MRSQTLRLLTSLVAIGLFGGLSACGTTDPIQRSLLKTQIDKITTTQKNVRVALYRVAGQPG